jgi:dipeptidyl aminopeptidase/acylaminoacyl peptidase
LGYNRVSKVFINFYKDEEIVMVNKEKISFIFLSALLLIFLLSTMSVAQTDKKTFELEDVFSIKAVDDPQISPDGSKVLFVVTENNLAENERNSDIYLVDIKGGTPLRLTYHKKSDRSPQWSPDGKYIAFISNREDKPQVWLMDARGGEPWKLTNHETGVQSFKWSPCGKAIAFVAMEPQSEEEKEKQKKGADEKVWGEYNHFAHLWLQYINQDKAEQITKGKLFIIDFAWSKEGQIAYLSAPGPDLEDWLHTSLTVLDVKKKEEKKIDYNLGWSNGLSWSPDGHYIAVVSVYTEGNITGSNIYLISSDGKHMQNITKNCEADVSGYDWLDQNSIIFSASKQVRGPLYMVNIADTKVKQLCDGDFVIDSISLNSKTKGIAFLKTDPTNPDEVYYTSLDKFEPVKLSDMNAHLAQFKLATTEVIQWKGADGWDIEGVLVKPIGYQPGKAYPTINTIHGGPAGVYSLRFNPSWQCFAAQGYAVYAPNPRGSSGYGQKFVEANYQDFGGKDYQDIMLGMDYLVKQGISDADKLAVYGYSYGGYMTSWVVTQTNRYKAAMLGAGLTNLFSFYSQSDIQWAWGRAYLGVTPYENPQLYRKMSAMTYINQVKTPTLIVYGAEDRRVPPPQGQEFYIALKKRGVPVEFVTYPREGHGFRELGHNKDFLGRTITWFNKYVLGKE